MTETTSPQNLSWGRNLKIGLFHLGSGMADVLTTGVWNRIMITDLGFRATPIGLLVSLRYFLAPLSIWAGRMSDRYAIGGYRRLFWVWLGRAMMTTSIFGLGLTTAAIARGADVSFMVWVLISLSLLLFSLGNAFSSSTFLALIYDRAPEHQRGRAVGLVWTLLLIGFAFGGAFFGILLPSNELLPTEAGTLQFSADTLRNLFVIAAIVVGSLWFFPLIGEERRNQTQLDRPDTEDSTSFMDDMRLALNNRQTMLFMWYLALSMAFSFSQDLILEPFAGDVFNMDAGVTTRFAAYWGTTAIVGSIVFLAASRSFKALTNTMMSQAGVIVLIAAFAMFAYAGFAGLEALIMPGLYVLGLGLGIWNIGTLGMMMEMSPNGKAGTFLGFWTLVVTVSRGVGVSGGGIVRDITLSLSNDLTLSYVMVFIIATVGLIVSFIFLLQTRTDKFRSDFPVDSAQMISAGMD